MIRTAIRNNSFAYQNRLWSMCAALNESEGRSKLRTFDFLKV